MRAFQEMSDKMSYYRNHSRIQIGEKNYYRVIKGNSIISLEYNNNSKSNNNSNKKKNYRMQVYP